MLPAAAALAGLGVALLWAYAHGAPCDPRYGYETPQSAGWSTALIGGALAVGAAVALLTSVALPGRLGARLAAGAGVGLFAFLVAAIVAFSAWVNAAC